MTKFQNASFYAMFFSQVMHYSRNKGIIRTKNIFCQVKILGKLIVDKCPRICYAKMLATFAAERAPKRPWRSDQIYIYILISLIFILSINVFVYQIKP